MKYGEALDELERGKIIFREGWFGKHFLFLTNPQGGATTEPFIVIRDQTGRRVPWLCSQMDGLARDWCTITLENFDLERKERSEIRNCIFILEGSIPRFKVGQKVLYEGGSERYNGRTGTVTLVTQDGCVGVDFGDGEEGVAISCLFDIDLVPYLSIVEE